MDLIKNSTPEKQKNSKQKLCTAILVYIKLCWVTWHQRAGNRTVLLCAPAAVVLK
jgi:hypothetical protein